MNQEQKQLLDILDHAWGTIGPKSLEAGKALASYCGVQYGLTLFSATAAFEASLRGQNIGYGDQVIVAAYGDPIESMAVALVGATPVFADIDAETLTVTAETAAAKISVHTRAIIMGLHAGNTAHVKAVAELCREKGLLFILNLSDAFGAEVEGEPAAKFADLSIINMEEGKLLNVGLAGAILCNTEELFQQCFSHHNCGRPLGVGSTLSFDQVLGSDLRIAEWQASLIEGRLEQYEADWKSGKRSDNCYVLMYNQPVWSSEYYKKQTGSLLEYVDADYPSSIQAAK